MSAPQVSREAGADKDISIDGMHCDACGACFAPPQPVCTRCGRDDSLEKRTLGGEGRLYSYTIVRVPPEGLEGEAPYAIGIVELEGGARITARIEGRDFDWLAIDQPVRLSRVERGVSFWGAARAIDGYRAIRSRAGRRD